LAKDGQAIGKLFNIVAGRPYPALTSLEQSISATLQSTALFNVTSTTVATFGNQPFALNSFANSAEYTGLFDQYRFDQIEVWLEPAASSTAVYGTIATAVDLDDANVPTMTSVLDKQGALISSGADGHYHRWAPHVAVSEYSGTFTSFGNVPATWVDSASPGVQHYGFKAYFSATPVALSYNLTVRAIVSFRAPGV
jgi:hypothetical protein